MTNEAPNVDKSIFNPTAEAKALEWKSLCPRTRDALGKIFFWLESACNANERIANGEQEKLAFKYLSPSTSILLAGDRGSGKTTVLLSAAYAYKLAAEQKGDYFGETDELDVKEKDLKSTLDYTRQKVFWLDTLDLEPLHPDTNLLTAILVRIRLAIESLDDVLSEDKSSRRRSILEGDLGTGEDLNRLINDATFMWEATLSGGSGPRLERSEEQINSAEKSAKFQNEFKDVMEKTIQLFRNRKQPQTELFVLPIDNVDRSIEHIANISKLIRLATSRRLWFILAAVRPEYQLFLERAFQKELLRSATSSNASNWDQTQAIARRQAATSMRRSLPENYQIRIEPLSPFQAWTFPHYFERVKECRDQEQIREKKKSSTAKATSSEAATTDETFANLCISLLESGNAKELTVLLDMCENRTSSEGTVKIENLASLRSKIKSGNVKELIDLFRKSIDLSSVKYTNINEILRKYCELLRDPIKERDLEYLFSEIQLSKDNDNNNKLRFKKLADLFNITSQLDNDARDTFLEATNNDDSSCDNIFTGAGKMALGLSMRTLLDLKAAIALYQGQDKEECAVEVSVRMLRNAIDESNLPYWASQQLLDRIIRKDSNDRWVLDLTNNPIRRFNQPQRFHEIVYPTASGEENKFIIEEKLRYQEYPDIVLELHNLENENQSYPLPPVIAGWFMILHDTLVLSGKPAVISTSSLPNEIFPCVVQTSHNLNCDDWRSIELNFEWRTPQWPTFAQHFLFAVQWTAILYKRKNDFTANEQSEENMKKYKDNAEKAYCKLQLAWIENICSVFRECRDDENSCKELITLNNEFANDEMYTKRVLTKLCDLVDQSSDVSNNRNIVIWNWLSRELPLFIGPEYSFSVKSEAKAKHMLSKKINSEYVEKTSEWNLLVNKWDAYLNGLEVSRGEIVRSAIENSTDIKSCAQPGNNLQEGLVTKIMIHWLLNTKETR